MKRFTKYVVALLVLCMIVSVIPAVSAAGYTAEPGQTVNVIFEVKNIMGIDGDFTVSDPNGIVASSKIAKVDTKLTGGTEENTLLYYGSEVTSFKLTYEVTLKATAAVNDQITVTFKYEVTDADYNLSEWKTMEETIIVVAPEPPKPTEPKPTEPAPTQPKPTEPKPTEPAVKVDYTKLNEQINLTDDLDLSLYSAESWELLQAALQAARAALKSGDQATVDAALAALRAAIDGLVALDLSALQAAIEKVEGFLNTDTIGTKAQELLNALNAAKELLNSQDQAAIDTGAELLVELLGELEKAIKDLTKIEEIIKEIEKIVEVEPSNPYCNISMHHVWPILFFISLFVNAAFVVLVVIYFVRRKKNETDDTPLVDYDIGDDVEGDAPVDDTAE